MKHMLKGLSCLVTVTCMIHGDSFTQNEKNINGVKNKKYTVQKKKKKKKKKKYIYILLLED